MSTATDALQVELDRLEAALSEPSAMVALAREYRADAGQLRVAVFLAERILIAGQALVAELRAGRSGLTARAPAGTHTVAQTAPERDDGGKSA